MMTRQCEHCEKIYKSVPNKHINYCPDCIDKEIHTKICTVCREPFESTHRMNYICKSCRSVQNKTAFIKNMPIPRKRQPRLMTDEEQYAIDMKFREREKINCEFVHLTPGMKGFEELAAKITPIQKIRKSHFIEPVVPFQAEEQRVSLFGRRENTKELR